MAVGLGFGDNTTASVITRGLAETARLAVRLGADAMTLMGLAGLGDLVATCSSPLSRNRTFGEKLGQGMTTEEITASTRQVAEGVKSCSSLLALAQQADVYAPIVAAVHAVVEGEMTAADMLTDADLPGDQARAGLIDRVDREGNSPERFPHGPPSCTVGGHVRPGLGRTGRLERHTVSPHRTPRAVPSGPRPLRRTVRVAVAGLVLPAALLAGSTGLPASSAQAPAASSTPQRVAAAGNPLAGHRWGVYKGAADQSWPPYERSTGTNRALLAKIALRPKAKWFGRWIGNGEITTKVRAYIANSTGGDPDVLTQMTMFRMVPWEHEACRRLPTAAEQASYKQWVNRAATGIGGSRVALILQPDGPFALCAPHGSTLPSRLVGYAARKFSALPRTSASTSTAASPTGCARTTPGRRCGLPDAGRGQVRARLRAELHALRRPRATTSTSGPGWSRRRWPPRARPGSTS